MKPFGEHSLSYRAGYTLGVCLSHLEGMQGAEAETLCSSGRGPKWKRANLVEEAVAKLTEACDMSEEE
jgi:hypothetical protein